MLQECLLGSCAGSCTACSPDALNIAQKAYIGFVQVMNSPAKLRGAVQWLCQSLTLDVDARVHVFEVTIRALGMISLQEL